VRGMLVGILFGVATGLFISPFFARPQIEAWEISPEARKHSIDRLFAEYKEKRCFYVLKLPVLGRKLNVGIVNEMRVTYEGFAPMSEIGGEPTQFWYSKNGECEIRKYNTETLFVEIRTRHALTLKRVESTKQP